MNYTITTKDCTYIGVGLESLLTAISNITEPYTIEEANPALAAPQNDTN
jgi:hypothetical protein